MPNRFEVVKRLPNPLKSEVVIYSGDSLDDAVKAYKGCSETPDIRVAATDIDDPDLADIMWEIKKRLDH